MDQGPVVGLEREAQIELENAVSSEEGPVAPRREAPFREAGGLE